MNIVDEAIKIIPNSNEILNKTFIGYGVYLMSTEDIVNNFNVIVKQIEISTFKKYREYEDQAHQILINLWMEENKKLIKDLLTNDSEPLNDKKENFSQYLLEFIKLVKELEFRTGQMRRSRGGGAFEKIIEILLNQSGISCEKPSPKTKKLMKRIDFVYPDAKTAEEKPNMAVFLTIKRTLSEKWKQVVPEQMKGTRLYIITMDDNLSEENADEMRDLGIIIYVPNEIKMKKELKEKRWVRKLSDLTQDIISNVPL